MITADQLVCHAIGDYILQSHWMATEKTKRSTAALVHVITYGLPFLFFRPSITAMAVIVGTHFVIDRWRLARCVVWAKNLVGPWHRTYDPPFAVAGTLLPAKWRGFVSDNPRFQDCRATGYPPDTPAWLAVWLLIIVDNIMHVVINGLALRYL